MEISYMGKDGARTLVTPDAARQWIRTFIALCDDAMIGAIFFGVDRRAVLDALTRAKRLYHLRVYTDLNNL